MQETPTTFHDPLSVQIRQVEAATRQNDLLEKTFMVRAIPARLKYIDDIAREIRELSRREGFETKKAVTVLIEYLDWLDIYHGTKEKQELIQNLGANPKFMKFKDALQDFETAVDQLGLTFLVDKDYEFDRLHQKLERFEGYKLTVVARSMASR
jgi:hypothetical protein